MRPIPGNPGQNLTRCAPSPEILDKTSQDEPHPRKSWTKPHKTSPIPEILDKTLHDVTHPRKSWTKPHTMRPIPGNPEIPKKTSQKDALLVGCWLLLLLVVPTTCAEAPFGGNQDITYDYLLEHVPKTNASRSGPWRDSCRPPLSFASARGIVPSPRN